MRERAEAIAVKGWLEQTITGAGHIVAERNWSKSFADIGLTSLTLVEMARKFRGDFQRDVSVAEFFEAGSPDKLERLLSRLASQSREQRLPGPRPSARHRLAMRRVRTITSADV